MDLLRLAVSGLVMWVPAAPAQVFVAALGGTAALSNGASAAATPLSASNYDSKVGAAVNVEAGSHLNDWFTVQAGYIWNRNRIVVTEVSGDGFGRRQSIERQDALSADLLLYFRQRSSRIRPYLSAGPAWVRVLSQDKLGLRVAVGADLIIRSGWSFRYSFSEMITRNPFAAALLPPAGGKLMNFQNLFGIMKTF